MIRHACMQVGRGENPPIICGLARALKGDIQVGGGVGRGQAGRGGAREGSDGLTERVRGLRRVRVVWLVLLLCLLGVVNRRAGTR